jgi:hypothetical protein
VLRPLAAELKRAHPAKLKAITTSQHKSDCREARMLADLLRCNLFPAMLGQAEC